jgi:protein TonB
MKEGRAAARWIVPLSASLTLHVAFFCLISSAAPDAPPAVTRGVTVVLRRVEGFFPAPAPASLPAAVPAKEADSGRVVPKTASVPKKDASPIPAKANRKTKAIKTERAPAARSAAKPLTDSASAVETSAASEARSNVSGKQGTSNPRGGTSNPKGGLSNPAGGGLAAGAGKIFELSDLKVSRRVRPDYPAIARKRKEEGTVTLLITLEGANVLSVTVEKSSGFSALDEAAAAAVRRWRFEPGRNAARVQARVPVTFKLK